MHMNKIDQMISVLNKNMQIALEQKASLTLNFIGIKKRLNEDHCIESIKVIITSRERMKRTLLQEDRKKVKLSERKKYIKYSK